MDKSRVFDVVRSEIFNHQLFHNSAGHGTKSLILHDPIVIVGGAIHHVMNSAGSERLIEYYLSMRNSTQNGSLQAP